MNRFWKTCSKAYLNEQQQVVIEDLIFVVNVVEMAHFYDPISERNAKITSFHWCPVKIDQLTCIPENIAIIKQVISQTLGYDSDFVMYWVVDETLKLQKLDLIMLGSIILKNPLFMFQLHIQGINPMIIENSINNNNNNNKNKKPIDYNHHDMVLAMKGSASMIIHLKLIFKYLYIIISYICFI